MRQQNCRWYTGNMQPDSSSGFREIEHTADWELEVWAPFLADLLLQAAFGMYQLVGVQISASPRLVYELRLKFTEPETLLVDFLNELLYIAESEGTIFDQFDLKIEGDQLHAKLIGAPVVSMGKEIKAATYHNLNIVETNHGLLANIVFDV